MAARLVTWAAIDPLPPSVELPIIDGRGEAPTGYGAPWTRPLSR